MKEITEQTTGDFFTDADIISRYTRAQAIEDGVLADISSLAKEAGFKYPVAISTGIVSIIEDAVNKGGKDWNGVVWDILTMLLYYIKRGQGGNRTDFNVLIWSKFTRKDQLVKMYAICGGGDDGEPVITVMLPTED